MGDIERLKVLKRLIVDQQLPLDFVKQLAVRSDTDFFAAPLGATQYLDIDAGEMRSKDELSIELWDDFLIHASEEQLAQRLNELWLVLARVLRSTYRTEASYTNRRDEIRRFANGSEFVGRIECKANADGDIEARLDPHIEDAGYSTAELISWLKSQRYAIQRLQAHATSVARAGGLTHDLTKRLWSRAAQEALNDVDDVPF